MELIKREPQNCFTSNCQASTLSEFLNTGRGKYKELELQETSSSSGSREGRSGIKQTNKQKDDALPIEIPKGPSSLILFCMASLCFVFLFYKRKIQPSSHKASKD